MSPNAFICCPIISPVDGVERAGEVTEDEDEVVNLKEVAVLGDNIVGIEVVALDEQGPWARQVQPLPSPQEPAPAERERHCVSGHIKYASWCPICVSCRRPNDHHRLVLDQERSLPLMVGDYAFVRNSGDDALIPVLIIRLYP